MDEKTNDESATEGEASRPASPGGVEPPAASAPSAVPLPSNKYHWTTIALVIVSCVAVFLLLTTLALGARAVFEHNRGRAGYGKSGGCDCCECPMRDRGFGKKGVAPPWQRDHALDGQGIPLPPQAPGSPMQAPPGPTQSAPLPVPGK